MSVQHMVPSGSTLLQSDFVISTQTHRWVIPHSCEILKALLVEQNIHAVDLQFNSETQCRGFVKRLLLLAATDECRNRCPSRLATLARELINYKPQPTRI